MRRTLRASVAWVVLACTAAWTTRAVIGAAAPSAPEPARSAATAATTPPAAPAAVKRAPRPTTATEHGGCVTPECHPDVKASPVLHAPVQMDACETCHEVADVKAHTFAHPRRDSAMCTFCHEFDVEGVPVVHTPVAKGQCLGCHAPHGGTDDRLMREASVAEMCGSCHEDVTEGRSHVHTPVQQGSCTSCHTSHASRFPKLLYAEGEHLCMTCHETFRAQMHGASFRHEAMREGCGKCHTPHASTVDKQLVRPVTELCTGECHEHEEVGRQVTRSKYRHGVATKDAACMTCHTPHGGDLAALLKDLPVRTCMTCHNERQTTARGTVVAALPELADPKTVKHGPINDGQCGGGCHQVHGSDQPKLLARANVPRMYQPLAAENYRLCFNCHSIDLAAAPLTKTATNFRNGELNLHFAHVANGERGRNCSVCHSTHASHFPKHVNDAVRFGQWQMPINLTVTETGGTCDTGCHRPYAYDRVTPAPRPTTRPTSRPSPQWMDAVATAATRPYSAPPRPEAISWSLRAATEGSPEVKVPARNRPTVLLFTSARHAQHEQLVRLVKAAGLDEPGGRAAVVVIVGGGEEPEREAREVAAKLRAPWPVVADVGGRLAGQLEVHLWPTTVVLREDGSQAARVAGAPESLALELGAYLDYANGKIDRAALVDRLARPATVGRTPVREARRKLAEARRMLEAGKVEQARRAADEVEATAPPASASVQAELIALLTRLGDLDRAAALVERLPASSLAPGQRQVLRARVLMARERWDEARAALEEALKEAPSSREAHLLLGQAYERAGQWERAARQYRAAHEAEGR